MLTHCQLFFAVFFFYVFLSLFRFRLTFYHIFDIMDSVRIQRAMSLALTPVRNSNKGEGILKIQQSAEDYLETILVLSRKKSQIRSIDIVNELGYSKPSVSVAMKNLRENGYISMDRDGYITLEEPGLRIAETIMSVTPF